ncbi:hypothetical protein Taro_031018, partial [Colocasia esculenta]|nr:hypothetical protein [Colocasia esculenta]
MESSHSPNPNHMRTMVYTGRGSCLGREGWTSLPPREERTRWGLLVGRNVSSSHRTARTRPLHERSDTLLSTTASTRGRHPKIARNSERAREREGERRGTREGEGLGRPSFKPTELRRRHTLCRIGNQKVFGYNWLVDHVGIHGQRRLTEALNKDSLVRQKEYRTESSSKSRKC